MSQPFLETARRAARAAGEEIRSRMPRPGRTEELDVRHKGRIDLVTEVDEAAERILREVLLGEWPEHSVLGEEEGLQGTSTEAVWIVDPIDGTRSFAHGFPWVCVSIALQLHGELEVAVVYNPISDELFEATRGGGARMNGIPLKVSSTPTLEQALLATGFPYQLREIDNRPLFDLFRELVVNSGGIRRAGSAAMDLVSVACGRLDGYWEFFLKPWDAAGGVLIAREAGALVSNLSGDAFALDRAEILCCNPHIQAEMIARAAPYLEDMRRWI